MSGAVTEVRIPQSDGSVLVIPTDGSPARIEPNPLVLDPGVRLAEIRGESYKAAGEALEGQLHIRGEHNELREEAIHRFAEGMEIPRDLVGEAPVHAAMFRDHQRGSLCGITSAHIRLDSDTAKVTCVECKAKLWADGTVVAEPDPGEVVAAARYGPKHLRHRLASRLRGLADEVEEGL